MNARISLFNAHTGATFQIKRFCFVSVDELKKFCSSEFAIPLQRLFLLSSFGQLVRNSSFQEIDDIYVYDKELFSIEGNDQIVKRYIQSQRRESYDSLIQPLRSPLLDISLESVAKSRNKKQLISLLTTNLGWVAAIESDCTLAVNKIDEFNGQINILFRSGSVASQYIDSYCFNIEKMMNESVEFVVQLQKNSLNVKWLDRFQNLKSLKMVDGASLSDLLDSNELSKTAQDSIAINQELNTQFQDFRPIVQKSRAQRAQLNSEIESSNKKILQFIDSTKVGKVFENLTKLSEKVRNDTRNLLNKISKSIDDLDVDIILETFELHKSQYVETIYEISMEIYSLSMKYKELYTNLQISSSQVLQKLSFGQLEMISLKESLKSIGSKIEEVRILESSLAPTVDLPLLYGLYIVENMRRDQWLTHIKSITVKTNEKFANIREREIKTRNQWVKNYGIILKLLNHDISSFNNRNIISFEIVKNEDSSKWQDQLLKYEDCVNYIQQLEKQTFIAKDVIEILTRSLKESVYKKPKLDLDFEAKQVDSETIKGYKSRVKKLENLLHQEQFKNFNQWSSTIESTKITNTLSRPPSLQDSRRKSSYETSSLFHPPPSRSPSPTHPQILEETQKLEIANKELQNKSELQQKQINDLNEELRAYKQALSANEFSSQGATQRNKETLHLKQSEINELTKKLAKEEVHVVKLESVIDSNDELIRELESRLKSQSDEIKKLKSTYDDEIIKVSESKDKEVEEMQAELENIVKGKIDEIIALKDEHTEKLKSVDKELNEKIQEIESLHTEHTNAIESLKVENEEILRLKESEIQTLKTDCEEKIKELAAIDDSPYSKDQVDKFENDLTDFQNEITSLRDQISCKSSELLSKTAKINELTSKIEITEKSSFEKFSKLEEEFSELKEENTKYKLKFDDWADDFERLKSMKNDLLENMANREDEFTKEKIIYQEEIESLKLKLEEFEIFEQNDDSDDIISKYKHLNFQLIIIINSLVIKSRDLSDILITFYDIFLMTLKSLGLLAVKDELQNQVNIIRVKGLKKNKDNQSMDSLTVSSLDLPNGLKSISKEDIIPKSKIWNDEVSNDSSLQVKLNDLSEDDSLNEELLTKLNDFVIDNYNLITFEKKYLDFVGAITNLDAIYYPSVSKRFNEVESLAKKELKENKKLRAESERMKISIKDFKIGDLVLFLPTRVSISKNFQESSTNTISKNEEGSLNQWAAFNDMGDCKFLMKNDDSSRLNFAKKWFIGRILDIEKVNSKEFLLSTEEVN